MNKDRCINTKLLNRTDLTVASAAAAVSATAVASLLLHFLHLASMVSLLLHTTASVLVVSLLRRIALLLLAVSLLHAVDVVVHDLLVLLLLWLLVLLLLWLHICHLRWLLNIGDRWCHWLLRWLLHLLLRVLRHWLLNRLWRSGLRHHFGKLLAVRGLDRDIPVLLSSASRHGHLQVLNIALDEGACQLRHLGWTSDVSDTVVVLWRLAPCDTRWVCDLNRNSDSSHCFLRRIPH